MRIVHITAGAGGRICGSCLHDNALVRALRDRGRDALLVPAFVPTTTDEENVAIDRVVMGGVNVWLQEHVPLLRYTPGFLDRPLDSQRLLNWLSSRTGAARAADLGPLTVSTLQGEAGRQRKEVAKLARWLAAEIRPDIVHLSNALLFGLARSIREATGAGIVASLSGEDVFIDQLPDPYREETWTLLRERAADVDQFVALNAFFAGFMGGRLGLPAERVTVVPHGVDLTAFPAAPPDLAARRQARGGRLRVGFLARACPEKGLDQAVKALAILGRDRDIELVAAGATVEAERVYLAGCLALAEDLGVGDRFEWRGQVDRSGKLALLAESDLFTLPTTHPEAKGLSVIEALAAGVPVVAADHGTFPELLDSERAGLLHAPRDPADLARAIATLADDPDRGRACGRHGHALARSRHSAAAMAAGHEAVYAEVIGRRQAATGSRG
ncbi:MAG: glycosyltransferase family 4 protein [Planctomycetota bacterium]